MPRLNGKNGRVKYGPGQQLIGKVQSWNADESAETVEGWGMGETAKETDTTVTGFSGSLEFDLDPTDPGAQIRAGDQFVVELYPAGDATGDTVYSGTVNVTGSAVSVSKDAYARKSVNFLGTGTLTEGVVP